MTSRSGVRRPSPAGHVLRSQRNEQQGPASERGRRRAAHTPCCRPCASGPGSVQWHGHGQLQPPLGAEGRRRGSAQLGPGRSVDNRPRLDGNSSRGPCASGRCGNTEYRSECLHRASANQGRASNAAPHAQSSFYQLGTWCSNHRSWKSAQQLSGLGRGSLDRPYSARSICANETRSLNSSRASARPL